jgi:hypothetical protein
VTIPVAGPSTGYGDLTVLVEAQRGMTDDEVVVFLTTGEYPDLSQPPVQLEVEPTEETGLTPEEAFAVLSDRSLVAAGGSTAPGEIALKFNPGQKRDNHGRWTDDGSGVDAGDLGDGGAGVSTRDTAPLVGAAALEAAPVSIANTRHELSCRPETLAICGGDQRRRKEWAGSLLEYRSTSYQDINNLLRHGFTDDYDEDTVRGWIGQIDQVMESSRLNADVTTMRGMIDASGIFGDAFEGDDDLTGYEWTEDAYVSTTVDSDIADHFGEGMIMHITVPAGVEAVQLSRLSEPSFTDEAELLLRRGLKMRVTGDRGRDRLNRRILDVEVVPA